jgi:hypothetical protein
VLANSHLLTIGAQGCWSNQLRPFAQVAVGSGRSVLRILGVTSLAAACAVAGSGEAWASSYNTSGLPPATVANIERLCQRVIGLAPGQGLFVGCVESLSATLQSQTSAAAGGTEPVESRFAAKRTAAEPADPIVDPRREAAHSKPYFYASRDEVRRRETVSCASLGLDLGPNPLEACVVDLHATLFNFENTTN